MAIKTKTHVSGLAEMEKNLRTLGTELAAKQLRTALMAAAVPVVQVIQNNAPKAERRYMKQFKRGKEAEWTKPGRLKGAIKRRSKISRSRLGKQLEGDQVARVHVGHFGAFYGRFLEQGTKHIKRKRKFVAHGVHAEGRAIQIFRKRLKRRIELTERKLKKTRAQGLGN